MLGLLLALAVVLFALGVGFFGLANLSRQGLAPPDPTPPSTTLATVPPKPVAVPTNTPVLAATATSEPSATPVPATPTDVPPTPSPVPPSATPRAQPTATPNVIFVPQLRGKTLEQAQAAVAAAGLTVTVRGVNANVDKNVVDDQMPDVGASLAPGGTVTLIVGSGSTAIPDVANQPRDQATLRLMLR